MLPVLTLDLDSSEAAEQIDLGNANCIPAFKESAIIEASGDRDKGFVRLKPVADPRVNKVTHQINVSVVVDILFGTAVLSVLDRDVERVEIKGHGINIGDVERVAP